MHAVIMESEHGKGSLETVESFCTRTKLALEEERKSEESVTIENRATISGRVLQRQGLALLNLDVNGVATSFGGRIMVRSRRF